MSIKTISVKIAVAFLTAATGACTIVPPCNQKCELETSARAMVTSGDIGLMGSGAKTLMGLHPEIDQNSKEVRGSLRDSMASQLVECDISSFKIVNGKKMLSAKNCTKLAPPAADAAPAPAAP